MRKIVVYRECDYQSEKFILLRMAEKSHFPRGSGSRGLLHWAPSARRICDGAQSRDGIRGNTIAEWKD